MDWLQYLIGACERCSRGRQHEVQPDAYQLQALRSMPPPGQQHSPFPPYQGALPSVLPGQQQPLMFQGIPMPSASPPPQQLYTFQGIAMPSQAPLPQQPYMYQGIPMPSPVPLPQQPYMYQGIPLPAPVQEPFAAREIYQGPPRVPPLGLPTWHSEPAPSVSTPPPLQKPEVAPHQASPPNAAPVPEHLALVPYQGPPGADQAVASSAPHDPQAAQTEAPAGQHIAPEVPHRVPLKGRRKSLLVGINYFGSDCELHGCINDVKRMLPVLDHLGFPGDRESRRVLLDEPGTMLHNVPTLSNLRDAISWLVEGAQAGDVLFFHYSGHGGQMPRSDGRGDSHETLCPVDMERSGMLLDTELFETLVRPLPSGCRLTCILDCCHSGGVLDVPYIFVGSQENIKKMLAGEAAQMVMSKSWLRDFEMMECGNPAALMADAASLGLGLWDLWGKYQESKKAGSSGFATDQQHNIGLAVAEVVAITGCRSDQTSADVGNVHSQFELKPLGSGGRVMCGGASGAGGALTSAFIEALQDMPLKDPTAAGTSYLDLLEHVRQRLANEGFDQVPQLCSTLLIDLREPFSVDTITLPAVGDCGKGAPNSSSGGGSSMAAQAFMAALAAGGGLGAAMLIGHEFSQHQESGYSEFGQYHDSGALLNGSYGQNVYQAWPEPEPAASYQPIQLQAGGYCDARYNPQEDVGYFGSRDLQVGGSESMNADYGTMLDTLVATGAAAEIGEAFYEDEEGGDDDGMEDDYDEDYDDEEDY